MAWCAVPAHRENHTRVPGLRRGRAARLVTAAGLLLTAGFWTACDFPSAMPRFESRFVVPLEQTRLTAADLLPSGVAVAGGAFHISVSPASLQRTLGQMCGAPCTSLQGLQVPKPAFTDAFALPLAMPPDVVGGVVTDGTAQVTVSHTFDFDPLRPPGATQSGFIGIAVRSAGVTLGTAAIDQAFPRNTQVTRFVPLAGPVAGNVEIVLTISSPAGSTVTVNNARGLTVSVGSTAVTASEARVVVQNRPVSVQPVALDLTGVDDGLRERVLRGALVLTMTNPFAVAGALQLRLQAPTSGADIQRPVQIAAGQTSQRVELTQAEVQALLGHVVAATVDGPVNGRDGPVVLRPDQQLIIAPRLDIVLEIGG